MAPSDFTRPPEGFRFLYRGMKTNARPDALAPDKYPLAINVRSYEEGMVRCRPGTAELFRAGITNKWFTDLRAYAALGTDDLPRILARNADDTIWLDNGTQVGLMAGAGASLGASMIPFRPNQSPNPYMYIANGSDYQKFSAPSAANAVIQQKVGIAEPPLPPEAFIMPPQVSFLANNPPYTPGGTAGSVTASARVSDTGVRAFVDPNLGPTGAWQVWQVSSTKQYQRGMEVDMGIAATQTIVEDVFPPIVAPLTVASIYYFSGTTGRCMVVVTGGTGPSGNSAARPTLPGGGGGGGGGGPRGGPVTLLRPAEGLTTVSQLGPGEGQLVTGTVGRSNRRGPAGSTSSIYGPGPLPELRRGSLVQFSSGSEVCMVLSVIDGSAGALCFETITVNTHAAGETITGQPAILVLGNFGAIIVSNQVGFAVTTGVGYVTAPLVPGFFAPGGFAFSPDDYLHFSVNVDAPLNLTEMKVLIDVGDGSFTQNYFYYTVRPNDLAQALANAQTQLAAAEIITQRAIIDDTDAAAANNQGVTFSSAQMAGGSSQWSEILFALVEMTRVGDDQTKTLQNANAIRFVFNTTGTVNAAIGSVNLSGGYQPDVGDVGAPYRYRIRGRSIATGAKSNPSPATRYGVTSRRRQVQVLIPQSAPLGAAPPYDLQIDTWDVFRYGGTVTSWQYIGSIPINNAAGSPIGFLDNFDDAFAQGGDTLEFDNFEPWPSVGLPFNGSVLALSGAVAVIGQPPSATTNLLPGNLVLLEGFTGSGPSGNSFVLTLRTRPISVAFGGGTFSLFQFEESAGTIPAGVTMVAVIQEPAVANQHLPYMWGPDVNGTVFACGDTLRPGTLYFAKNNNPDSAPDRFNIEICPPSEPLLGGEVVDGLSFVWSTERCWALYPTPDNPVQRYNFVQQPFPRGLAAPFGHCTDGKTMWWWVKDGIMSSEGQGTSITDEDLYNIFPHEGVVADAYNYNGVAVLPPFYNFANQFRLSHSNGFLYAIYVDGVRVHHIMVYDIKRKSWTIDQYPSEISAVYHVEQQVKSGPDTGVQPTRNPVTLLAGRNGAPPFATQGIIFQQSIGALGNDGTTPIACTLAVREWDGGDVRAPVQWGDIFVDLVPGAKLGVVVTPTSLGAPVAAATTIPNSATGTRTRQPVSMNGVVVSDFMGLFVQWSDDFANQSFPTQLFVWQPSYDIQPAKSVGWTTFGTSFGKKGYMHIPRIALAWVSTAPITLTITTVDGSNPQVLTIPSSGGVYQKQKFNISANKGQLYVFAASSTAPFQIFEDDIEILVGEWGREGPYEVFKSFGGVQSSQSPV